MAKTTNGPIRQRTAMAMGGKPTVGTGGGNPMKFGNAGQGKIPGPTKTMPTTVPFKSAVKGPKGAK